MSRRDAVIAKVVKMLRLARAAGSEAEAHTALTLAQRLMYAHDITEGEVADPSAEPLPIDDQVIDESGGHVAWKEYLAAVVAENFRCAPIISRSKTSGRVRLVFVGRKDDVAVATEAYAAAAVVAANLADACAATRLHHHKEEARASFLTGFLKGLYDRFQENLATTALLVVADAAVIDHATGLANGGQAEGGPLVVTDPDALREGLEAGYDHAGPERRLR